MIGIKRSDIIENNACSGIVEAGDFVFINHCVGNFGQSIENQINGAMDHLQKRLESIGLTLESVVKLDCMFRDVWNIPIMEKYSRKDLKENILHENQYKQNLLVMVDRKDYCFNLMLLHIKVKKMYN